MELKMIFCDCMFFFVSSQHPTRERKKVLATLFLELVSFYRFCVHHINIFMY